ncbi:MAG: hypothetical protein Q8L93_09430 [Rhodocyclaceae bacterium]|nr:hypothetical protein [Rhodocyclaceae bacterium]
MPSSLHRNLSNQFTTWALRGRPPEPVPVVLSQRRVYVLPSSLSDLIRPNSHLMNML